MLNMEMESDQITEIRILLKYAYNFCDNMHDIRKAELMHLLRYIDAKCEQLDLSLSDDSSLLNTQMLSEDPAGSGTLETLLFIDM